MCHCCHAVTIEPDPFCAYRLMMYFKNKKQKKKTMVSGRNFVTFGNHKNGTVFDKCENTICVDVCKGISFYGVISPE